MRINDIANLADGTYRIQFDGTICLITDVTEGYWIGVAPLEAEDLNSFGLFGVWTNAEGIKEFDYVILSNNLESALRYAKGFDQVAIWDIANGVEIAVTK